MLSSRDLVYPLKYFLMDIPFSFCLISSLFVSLSFTFRSMVTGIGPAYRRKLFLLLEGQEWMCALWGSLWGKLILLPPLCPHSFPWAVLSSIHMTQLPFKMLILLYGGRKLPLWNEASHAIFSRKGIHFQGRKECNLCCEVQGYIAWLGLGLLLTNHDPQTCS